MRRIHVLRSVSVTVAVVVAACTTSSQVSPPATAAAATANPSADPAASFSTVAERLVAEHLAAHPSRAVELGLHDHDGRLPDVSADGLKAETERLTTAIDQLEALDAAGLEPRQRVERAALLTTLRGTSFDLVARRQPWRNPMFYMEPLGLTAYISRDYAPVGRRAEAIIAIAKATPAYLEHAQSNLEPQLPRTFIDTALLQARGHLSFVRKDVPAAMSGLDDETRRDLDTALETMATALQGYVEFLESRREQATDDFALGRDVFTQMLGQTQGIEVDLDHLESVLQTDLERNLAAMEQAAKKIAPQKSVEAVMAKVRADRPKPDAVLATATDQAEKMRAFLVEHDIVSIPTQDVAKVVESPPFMRWNAAFLDSAGPYETQPLPSFYYISPPDPAWPKKKQREYIPGNADLLFITIHEVWPGHFLHGLHVKTLDSEVLRALWNYTTGEGWAHYTEEMMWNQGVSDDPAIHMGQLQNALLRNVRAISAIGLHTKGMTVEQSKQMFVEKAFQDQANAEQQAVRGTFDPMYLAYTVGKLAIIELRADVEAKRKAAGEPFDLRAFHDELLSHGAAPLSAIRESMLGPDANPVL